MTWHVSIVCALVAAWAVPAASQDRPVRSDQQILIQLEHEWDEAFYRKDVRFIERTLADEYSATYDDGSRGDKAKELAQTAEFNQQVDSSTLDEFTVKVYGDTAVVWFTKHLVGPSQGVRHEVTYRSIDVFVWRADRWQCVATQSTKVAAK
jgi:ketosteroid isomerase-like protein